MTSPLAAFTRQALIDGWLTEMAYAFPGQVDRLARRERDAFRDPVASALRRAAAVLVDELAGGLEPDRVRDGLNAIVRLRALSDANPEVTVGLIRAARAVFRDVLARPDCRPEDRAIYGLAAGRLPELERLASELFQECRTDLCSIAVRAARRRAFVADRARARHETPDAADLIQALPGRRDDPK